MQIEDVRMADLYGDYLRVISVDPGSNNCGISVIAVGKGGKRHVAHSYTTVGRIFEKDDADGCERIGARDIRLFGYQRVFEEMLEEWQPHQIVCESSFYRRGKANTFQVLSQQVILFKVASFNWNRSVPFTLVSPTEVKRNMGVKPKGTTKEDMHVALLGRTDLSYDDSINPHTLDEHECDSICVGLHHLDTF